MKNVIMIIISILFVSCENQKKEIESSASQNRANEIDRYVHEIQEIHRIPGLALAVIKDGEVYHKMYNGLASIEENDSVDSTTIFRIYSTTKLITSTGFFQLMKNNNVSLEDKISKYIEGLPEAWQSVTIGNLLTHSSGIPDMIRYESTLTDSDLISQMSKDDLDFKTGDRFWYNQTNYWLLARIIEKLTGESFEEYILANQFLSDSAQVFFSSNSLMTIPNRAYKYAYNFNTKQFERTVNNDGRRAHPGNGLNITLEAFIEWNKRLDENNLLDASTKSLMWSPYTFANKTDKFRFGWGDYSFNSIESIGFTGGGVCGFRKYPNNDLTIIFLSNGYKFFPVHDRVIDHIAGLVDTNFVHRESLSEESVILNFLHTPVEEAMTQYNSIKKENPSQNFEGILNSLGYALMKDGRTEDALKIFNVNITEHPNSSNAFDSCAEGYFNDNQLELSFKYYQRSLELNPENNNAKVMMDVIKKQLTAKN